MGSWCLQVEDKLIEPSCVCPPRCISVPPFHTHGSMFHIALCAWSYSFRMETIPYPCRKICVICLCSHMTSGPLHNFLNHCTVDEQTLPRDQAGWMTQDTQRFLRMQIRLSDKIPSVEVLSPGLCALANAGGNGCNGCLEMSVNSIPVSSVRRGQASARWDQPMCLLSDC